VIAHKHRCDKFSKMLKTRTILCRKLKAACDLPHRTSPLLVKSWTRVYESSYLYLLTNLLTYAACMRLYLELLDTCVHNSLLTWVKLTYKSGCYHYIFGLRRKRFKRKSTSRAYLLFLNPLELSDFFLIRCHLLLFPALNNQHSQMNRTYIEAYKRRMQSCLVSGVVLRAETWL